MIQKHFFPTRFYMLFIDIRVILVINIITLRPCICTIFFLYIYILYLCFLYNYFIVILSFSQYCQICYNLICSTIFNENLTHVMYQIVLKFFLGGHVISTSICFYMVSLAQPTYFFITYVLYIIISL